MSTKTFPKYCTLNVFQQYRRFYIAKGTSKQRKVQKPDLNSLNTHFVPFSPDDIPCAAPEIRITSNDLEQIVRMD